MKNVSLELAGKLVYADYKVHAAKIATNRSGFLVTGYCDDDRHHYAGMPGAKMSLISADPHRPESIAEHTEGCIQLALAVSIWRPGLISADELRRAMQLFLWHDAPEVKCGDVPDDGNRDDNAKDAQEYKILCEQVEHWPVLRREELLADYRKFQRRDGMLFQVLYCIDKVEAILRALEYERNGIVIDIRRKFHELSEQDCHFAEEIGSYLVPDGWARHALDRIRGCDGRQLAYWIMVAAFRDVRGEAPEWLLKWRV